MFNTIIKNTKYFEYFDLFCPLLHNLDVVVSKFYTQYKEFTKYNCLTTSLIDDYFKSLDRFLSKCFAIFNHEKKNIHLQISFEIGNIGVGKTSFLKNLDTVNNIKLFEQTDFCFVYENVDIWQNAIFFVDFDDFDDFDEFNKTSLFTKYYSSFNTSDEILMRIVFQTFVFFGYVFDMLLIVHAHRSSYFLSKKTFVTSQSSQNHHNGDKILNVYFERSPFCCYFVFLKNICSIIHFENLCNSFLTMLSNCIHDNKNNIIFNFLFAPCQNFNNDFLAKDFVKNQVEVCFENIKKRNRQGGEENSISKLYLEKLYFGHVYLYNWLKNISVGTVNVQFLEYNQDVSDKE